MFQRYLSSAVVIHAVAFVTALSAFGHQNWQSSTDRRYEVRTVTQTQTRIQMADSKLDAYASSEVAAMPDMKQVLVRKKHDAPAP
jgi:hypothetical protein